jgi:chromosomal replication initiator protein
MFVQAQQTAREGGSAPNPWARLGQELEQQLGEAHYNAWFSRLLCRSFTADLIQIVAQNQFTKDWIQRRYLNEVQSAALRIDGRRRIVQVQHEGEVPRSECLRMTALGAFVPEQAGPVVVKAAGSEEAASTASENQAPHVDEGSQRISVTLNSVDPALGKGDSGKLGSVARPGGSGERHAARKVPSTLQSASAKPSVAPEGVAKELSAGRTEASGPAGRDEEGKRAPSPAPEKSGMEQAAAPASHAPSGEGSAAQPFWMRSEDQETGSSSSGSGPDGSGQAGENSAPGPRSESTPERERQPSTPGRPSLPALLFSAPSAPRSELREDPGSPTHESPAHESPAHESPIHEEAREALRRRQAPEPRPSREAFSGGGGGGGDDGGDGDAGLFFSDFVLNDAFTFDSFVVGDCNELAHASAKAITEFPGRGYNPFFLYGGSGLGKTHLLQAICHDVRRRHNRKRIVYLSCESFVNQFIQAITDGELDQFRQRCRQVDLLVIDDIQFLDGKARTQDEFFHTFNSLFHCDKQIVLSCDRAPKEIPTLQERLISRFRWGMVTEVERPRYETRVAIVQRKAELRGLTLSPEVAECIAEHIDSNIRELEGAVTKVMNFADLMHRPIDLDTVRDALRDLVPDQPRVAVQDILDCVCKEFRLSSRELQSRKRAKSIVRARQVAMYLSRELTSLSFEEIGSFFGGRDHTTVMHGHKRMQAALSEDPDFAQKLERLRLRLQRGS